MSYSAGVNGAPPRTMARCLQCGRKAVVQKSLRVVEVERCDECRKADKLTWATFPGVES